MGFSVEDDDNDDDDNDDDNNDESKRWLDKLKKPADTESPTADATADSFRIHRTNAPRIPHERWEEFKPVLLDKCQIMTFDELARYMEREHDFRAK